MASNFVGVQPIKVVKRFSQRQKKKIDIPRSHCFMRYNQRMDSVNLLDCFISQYRPTINVKKWYYPLFLNCISISRVAAWQLHVILQRDPQKDQSDFLRSVMIEFLRNVVRPETSRALKSGQRITNESIRQHQPVDGLKQCRSVWCKKNTAKECYEGKVRLHAIAFCLIMQPFTNDAITASCCRCR